jgi:eukaryotic-like serine/threonine-protein kinase
VPLAAGSRLGSYDIRALLGEGGMGQVYLAHDARLGRDVAIKVLSPDVARDAEHLARFEREARTVAALNHPGIVTIHAVEEAGSVRFLVMERIVGKPLGEVIGGDGLPIGRVLDLAVPIADALAAAHDKGIVHRDLKPANVMVTDEGRVKVLDFGLAKAQPAGSASDLTAATTVAHTRPGHVVGTIPYMAPEQCLGEPVDARADIFAFGAMLYEMAAGVRAFRGGSSAEIMSAVLEKDPAPLELLKPALPARFTRIVSRCLEKDPRRRVQSAIDLCHELQDMADELRSGPARIALPVEPAVPGPTRLAGKRRWLAPAAVGAVAVLLVAAWAVQQWKAGARSAASGSPIHTVAVLPFTNLSQDPAQDYWVDGMHDAVITGLVQQRTVTVTSRNAVMRYKGQAVTARDAARELNVDAVIGGSVLRSGGRVRIDARLIRGATEENVWANSYDRDVQDVLKLLNEVSRAIAGEVRASLEGGGAPAAAATAGGTVEGSVPQVRPDAYDAYLRGRYAFSLQLSPTKIQAAREQFLLATTLDPGFAPGWSGLAATHAVEALFDLAPAAEALEHARDATRRALALSPDDGVGVSVDGLIDLYFDWNFDSARTKLARAVTLRPHEAMLRHGWADYLMVTGRFDESLEQTRLGRSDNPTLPLAAQIVAFHAAAARRYEDAVLEGRRALLLAPGAAAMHKEIGEALWGLQKYSEAVDELRMAAGKDGDAWRLFEDTYRRSGPQAALKAYSAHVAADLVAAGGRRPVDVAAAFAGAGDGDRAMEWLERGYAAREPLMLHVPANAAFDALRGDPRFEGLLRRIGIKMPPLNPKRF